jgi:hypothetical protein
VIIIWIVLNLEVSFEQTFFWNWASGQVVGNFLSTYSLILVVISHVIEGVQNIWNMFWRPSDHINIAQLLKFPQLNCVGEISVHESIFRDDASDFRRAWGKSLANWHLICSFLKSNWKIRGQLIVVLLFVCLFSCDGNGNIRTLNLFLFLLL